MRRSFSAKLVPLCPHIMLMEVMCHHVCHMWCVVVPILCLQLRQWLPDKPQSISWRHLQLPPHTRAHQRSPHPSKTVRVVAVAVVELPHPVTPCCLLIVLWYSLFVCLQLVSIWTPPPMTQTPAQQCTRLEMSLTTCSAGCFRSTGNTARLPLVFSMSIPHCARCDAMTFCQRACCLRRLGVDDDTCAQAPHHQTRAQHDFSGS